LRSLQRREMARQNTSTSVVEGKPNKRWSTVWHVSYMWGEAILGLIELIRTMEWVGPRTRPKLLLVPRKSIRK
jgi:hypothetical protein